MPWHSSPPCTIHPALELHLTLLQHPNYVDAPYAGQGGGHLAAVAMYSMELESFDIQHALGRAQASEQQSTTSYLCQDFGASNGGDGVYGTGQRSCLECNDCENSHYGLGALCEAPSEVADFDFSQCGSLHVIENPHICTGGAETSTCCPS